MLKSLRLLAVAGVCAMAAAASAHAADFYAGKRITLVVNLPAGSVTDIHARQVADFLAKNIAGNPSIIIQNVAGSGGTVGINFMGQKADKDGLTVAFMTTVAVRSALRTIEDTGLQVDPAKFQYVATTGGTSYAFIRSDVAPGIKKPEDLMKAEEFVLGGSATTNPVDLRARLVLDLLGVKYKYVTGFNGSGPIRTALIQGEVDYHTESAPGFRGQVMPTLIKDGVVTGLYYYELDDGETLHDRPEFSAGLPEGMMAFSKFYEKVKGAPPSGILWEAFRQMNRAANTPQRAVFLPEGAPKEAYDALAAAFDALNNDKDYQADSVKKTGAEVHWETGAKAGKIMQSIVNFSPEVLEFMKGYIAKVQK